MPGRAGRGGAKVIGPATRPAPLALSTPRPSAAAFVTDRQAIRTVLVNLLENSFDACRTDFRKDAHEVAFAVRPAEQEVIFEISDNSVGMDQETREKAFCLFFSSKGAEVTGLGLFIAHKVVTQHGGNIEIESTPGKGTRFEVRLRRSPPEDAEGELASGEAGHPPGGAVPPVNEPK